MKRIIAQVGTFIKETDKFLLALCFLLSGFGILMVQSATRHSFADAAISRDALVMTLAVSIGIVIALLISIVEYTFIVRLWPLIGAVCVVLMILTFIFGVGPESRSDARTWLDLGTVGGVNLYFQPSELVKIGFIITFAAHLDAVKEHLNEIKTLALLVLHGAVPVLLVYISGDMGSSLIFMLIFVVMLFTAGLSMRWFLAGAVAVAVAVPVAWRFVLSGIQKDRILALIHPEDYEDIIYQQQQGLRAIGTGGFLGKGLFNGWYTQNGYVPEQQNDMIFSAVGEEFGFVGCVLVLAVFTVLIVHIARTGRRFRDGTVDLLCSGVAAMIASQVIVNVGMVLQLLPVIGITLPFMSAGGSSNLCIYIAVGLVLSLRRSTDERDVEKVRIRAAS